MLIDCTCRIIKNLLNEVIEWILDLGEEDYLLTDEKNFLGDTSNKDGITIIITHVKRAIYSSKLNGTYTPFDSPSENSNQKNL